MVEGWTKNLLSEMMVNSVTWICRRKTKDRVLSSRTVLEPMATGTDFLIEGGKRRRSLDQMWARTSPVSDNSYAFVELLSMCR